MATFPSVKVDRVRVRVSAVSGADKRAAVAIRDISVDDLVVRRSFAVPEKVPTDGSFLLTGEPGTRACRPTVDVPDCDARRIRGSEEPAGVRRVLRTSGGTFDITGWVVARGTRSTALRLEPIDPQQVGATSIYGADPRVSSRFLYDANPATVWMSDDADENPTLVFTWKRPQRISGLRVVGTADGNDRPTRAIVRTKGRTQEVVFSGDAMARFDAVRTKTLRLTFPKPREQDHVVVSDLTLLGVDVARAFDPKAETGALCGFGPNVVVDGARYTTAVTGTMGDLVSGRPLRFKVCAPRAVDGADVPVTLTPGRHVLSMPPSAEFELASLSGVRHQATTSSASSSRQVRVQGWGASSRKVSIASGDATLLWTNENFNPGWNARLGNKTLEPLRVDGWRQGWVVPRGSGGLVEITYGPQTLYALVVGLGVASIFVFLLAAGFVAVRGRRRFRLAAAGPTTLAAPPPWRPVGVGLAVLAGLLLLGTVAGLALFAGWLLGARWPRRVLAVSAGAILLSGVIDAVADAAMLRDGADVISAAALGLALGVAGRSTPGGRGD